MLETCLLLRRRLGSPEQIAATLSALSLARLQAGDAAAAEEGEAVARIGRGSYAVKLPPGAKEPQSRIFKTAQFKGPVPTSDWWSSLAWVPFSEAQYAHPLVLRAE